MPVQFNESFFEELSRSEPVAAICDEAADRVASVARSTAPKRTNAYADGIVRASKVQKRYVALVIASDPKSLIIESKTGNLARALRAAKKRG